MAYRALTIDQLEVSIFNVRTDKRPLTPASIAVMAGSLLKRGQIMPLIAHPQKGRKNSFGVIIGQRRLLAFRQLIETGQLPREFEIDVIIRETEDEADLIDLSAAENLIRVDLYEYEKFAALARSFRRGHTYAQIGEGLGQPDINWVKRGVRLGMLAEPIFKAYADGLLPLECAKAFAATEDTKLQLQAFQEFQRLPAGQRTAAMARQLLKVGDHELTRLFLFVGEAAYRGKGGRFELDLFADEDEFRGLVTDEALLRGLADGKLEALRTRIRARVGRHLRFEPSPPINDFRYVDQSLQIRPPLQPLDDVDEARLVELAAEQADLRHRAEAFFGDEGPLPGTEAAIAELDARRDANQAEIDAIEDKRPIVLPEGDIFGTITIDDTGDHEVRFWWASRAVQAAATRPAGKAGATVPTRPAAPPKSPKDVDERPVGEGDAIRAYGGHQLNDWSAGERADRFAKRDYGVTQEGVQALRSLRRELLRGQLLENGEKGGTVAFDYLIWGQLRMMLTRADAAAVGMRRFVQADRQDAAGLELISETTAGHFASAFDDVKGWPCFTLADLVEAFAYFRALSADDRQHAAAMLACLVLERSLQADGYRIQLHDVVAAETGFSAPLILRDAEAFTPTPPFFNLFSKEHRLALLEPLISRPALVVVAKARTADQNAAVSRIFTGDDESEPEDALGRDVAKAWVHPLLAFDTVAPATAALEAAE